MENCVVISKIKEGNYFRNYVSLPRNYGTRKYYLRDDVQAIVRIVNDNLHKLNKRTNFLENIKNKKVIIKPNLVSVQHKIGFQDDDYPQTTDPRVLDAIILFLKPFVKEIVIAESSGGGVPTRLSFIISGLNRLAKKHKIKLIPLEEQPVDRYILPKAKIMKEILIPKLFSEVIKGEAFYISVPKMKTNLYTEVTLGFKNAMGIIPNNLRLRNHNYLIDEKLVDILFLIKPDLVIIDGIIGGEGNTPAPVNPVESNIIISGTNCVETDKIATEIMGFNPEKIKLVSQAIQMGFGDTGTTVIGKKQIIPFKKADRSLLSEQFKNDFPNVKILIGHTKNFAPLASSKKIDSDTLKNMEHVCLGGCLASIRSTFDYFKFQGHKTDFSLTLIIGSGFDVNNMKCYYDQDGKMLSLEDIKKLKGKKVAVGSCTEWLKNHVDLFIPGCMPKPVSPILKIFRLLKIPNRNFNPLRNKFILVFILSALKRTYIRRKLIKKGFWLDCPENNEDKIFLPEINYDKQDIDFYEEPYPEMTLQMKKQFLKNEKIFF